MLSGQLLDQCLVSSPYSSSFKSLRDLTPPEPTIRVRRFMHKQWKDWKSPIGLVHFSKENFQGGEYEPHPQLQRLIDNYWHFAWDLPVGTSVTGSVVPNGCVNSVFEVGNCRFTGPRRELFSVTFEKKGSFSGVLFRPGGFFPFFKRNVSTLLDGRVEVTKVFEDGNELENKILEVTDPKELSPIFDEFFLRHLPPIEEEFEILTKLISIVSNEEIFKVDELSEASGFHSRKIQRLFEKYVGVSPKSFIITKRFQLTVRRIEEGTTVDWAKLAFELGYTDQAHFINEFKSIIGKSPEEIRAQLKAL